MSIESLRSDFKSMQAEAAKLPTDEISRFMNGWMVPFMENVTAELGDIDDAVADFATGDTEVLGEESGALFGAVIVSGLAIANELKTRVGSDARLLRVIHDFETLCREAQDRLSDVMVDDDDDDDDEPDQDPPIVPPTTKETP